MALHQTTERTAIPDVLPTLKADLAALCIQHHLPAEGTVKDLRARLIAQREEGGQTFDEAELRTFPLAQLKELCAKLGLSPEGDKDELLRRVLAKKSSSTVSPPADDWTTALRLYQPKLKLEELELDWGLSPVLLTPALWPVLMWREPISRSAIYGPVGTDGPMLEALRKRWTQLLGCDSEALTQLCGWFVTLWTIVQASRREPSVTPRSWLRDHYLLHVDPVIRAVRLLQARQMERAGQTRLAKRIQNLASVPHEMLGYDIAELAERHAVKRGRDDDLKSDSDVSRGGDTRRGRRNREKGVCKRCGLKATPEPGVSNKEWFKMHNPKCPKK